MDSLFEGMVLFSPSQLVTDQSLEGDHSESQSQSHHDAPSLEVVPAPASSSSEPLDEDLFSDLTLQTPEYQPSPSKTKSSRKKKKAAGLRIGYARDSPRILPDGDYDDDTFDDDSSIVADETSSTSNVPDKDKEKKKDDDYNNPQQRFEHVKTRILEKLNTAREFSSSVSAARKDSIRRRRKASEDLLSASLKHSLLEKHLDEACEAEDFETAQRISDDLASSENHKQSLLIALRDAEAHCDAVDSQVHQVLLSQIAAEEESASLLYRFSADAKNDADVFLKQAETLSSEEMEKWLSSTEALEGRKIELEIESHLVNDARSVLNNSVDAPIEDDKREKEFLCKRKNMLFDELQKLLALVREKEKEIADNDSKIQAVEKRIADALSGFQELQSSVDTKFDNLQSAISQLELESEALLMKKKEIDEFLKEEVDRVTKLKEIARVSADEAKAYQEMVGLRRSLMSSVLKSRDYKVRLAKTEEKLSEEIQMLQQEVSAARTSLQELSSMKSSIQQTAASFRQRILFTDKRAPELEAEKKVAATARNFKEAARIAAEAKSLSGEKDSLQIEMDKAVLKLEKLEGNFKDTVKRLQETEELIISKEKEMAVARFQRLLIVSGAATAERSAALELGNLEEANLLLGEAEAADQEAKKLKPIYNLREEEFENLPKHFISMELVANFGKKQLAELAASVHLSSA